MADTTRRDIINRTGYGFAFGAQLNTRNYLGRLRLHLVDAAGPLPVPGQWYRFRVVRSGHDVRLYIDGKKVMEDRDDLPLTGKDQNMLGFHQWSGTTYYDNVKVFVAAHPARLDEIAMAYGLAGQGMAPAALARLAQLEKEETDPERKALAAYCIWQVRIAAGDGEKARQARNHLFGMYPGTAIGMQEMDTHYRQLRELLIRGRRLPDVMEELGAGRLLGTTDLGTGCLTSPQGDEVLKEIIVADRTLLHGAYGRVWEAARAVYAVPEYHGGLERVMAPPLEGEETEALVIRYEHGARRTGWDGEPLTSPPQPPSPSTGLLSTERGENISLLAELIYEVARTLTDVHRAGCVYGDVCGDNIYCLPDGKVKLALNPALRKSGTPEYVQRILPLTDKRYRAPEAWKRDPGAAGDVYGLGVLWYQWLSGHHPHEHLWRGEDGWEKTMAATAGNKPRDIREYRHDVSDGVWQVLVKMLAPADTRYPDAGTFLADLEKLRDGNVAALSLLLDRYARTPAADMLVDAAFWHDALDGVADNSLDVLSLLASRIVWNPFGSHSGLARGAREETLAGREGDAAVYAVRVLPLVYALIPTHLLDPWAVLGDSTGVVSAAIEAARQRLAVLMNQTMVRRNAGVSAREWTSLITRIKDTSPPAPPLSID